MELITWIKCIIQIGVTHVYSMDKWYILWCNNTTI